MWRSNYDSEDKVVRLTSINRYTSSVTLHAVGKVVSVHATKTLGSGHTSVLIHNLSMIWRLVASFTLWSV